MGEQKDSDRRSEGANDFFKPEPPEKQRETLHAILFEHFYKHKNFLHSAAWYYTDEQAKAFCKLMDKEWNDPSSNARKENNRLSSVLLHLPQDQPGLNIVDLGCGPGEKALLITGNFLHYNERGNTRIIHYFPVDISSNMLKSSIKAVRKAAALENAKCYVDENIDRIVETLSALGALEQEAGWSVTKDVKQGIQGKYTAFNTTINGIKGELRNMGLAGIENIIKELTHIETKCAESLKRLEHMSRNEIILLQARASFDALELPHPKFVAAQFKKTLTEICEKNAELSGEGIIENAYKNCGSSGCLYNARCTFGICSGLALKKTADWERIREILRPYIPNSLISELETVDEELARLEKKNPTSEQVLAEIENEYRRNYRRYLYDPDKEWQPILTTGRQGIQADIYSVDNLLNAIDTITLVEPNRMLVMLLGQTLGNFPDNKWQELLHKISRSMRAGDYFLFGVELRKQHMQKVIEKYDSEGARDFVYKTIEALGIPKQAFRYETTYAQNAVHITLVAEKDVKFPPPPGRHIKPIEITAGARIPFAYSYKFTRAEVEKAVSKAGLKLVCSDIGEGVSYTDKPTDRWRDYLVALAVKRA